MPRSVGWKAPPITPATCFVELADEALEQFARHGMPVDEEITDDLSMGDGVRLFAEWLEKRWALCVYSTQPEVIVIGRTAHRGRPAAIVRART
jgi:hypothetical protein